MNNSNNILVREYLSSLKEDKELDYLFPILLNVMGFRIIQTAKESKGQSQYGKDIIAVGNDYDGKKHKWYFELKGYTDRDITDKNYSTTDGVRESLIEAKDTVFKDSSISGFNDLPIKIVLVHNGVLKTNIRPTFEGFISKEFKSGEFERWDIYHLTDLFSSFLFSEYLLADDDSNRLLKKTLAFLDAPDNDFSEFKELVILQLDKVEKIKGRSLSKLFATLNLLQSLTFHYSKENKNLIAAKECSKFLILQTWSWILKKGIETKEPILKEFRKLLNAQHQIFNEYFKKTYPIAVLNNGLYAENGAFFEAIGYPLRCFEFLSDALYYCQLRAYYPTFKKLTKSFKEVHNKQKDLIIELINNNSATSRPIIDNHSIPILQLFLFISDKRTLRQSDVDFIANYIFGVINNILIIKFKRNRFPELYNRIELISEFICSQERPEEYVDSSSILMAVLLELLVIFDANDVYNNFRENIQQINLQIPVPNYEEFDIEQLLFEKHMDQEYYIESYEKLPEDFEDFKENILKKEYVLFNSRTIKAGFPFLLTLAHQYYKNELFSDSWRKFFNFS